jgi:hypothetical protein
MTRAFDALQALLEDASLREDLTDDEAAPLFDWAADQLKRLDAQQADDAAFAAAVGAIRRLVKTMNWLVGQRSYADQDTLSGYLMKAAAAAQEAGLNPPTLPFSAQALPERQDGAALMGDLLASMAAPVPLPPAATDPQEPEPTRNFGWLRGGRARGETDHDTDETSLPGETE